jgi:5'-3' exonuclease
VSVTAAPFEADTQLIALLHQGIADFALTNDSDIPFQGAPRTLMKLTGKGNCSLVEYSTVLRGLQKEFKSPRELTFYDISLYACLLGNDYVRNLPNSGPVATKARMAEFLRLPTPTPHAQQVFVEDYIT